MALKHLEVVWKSLGGAATMTADNIPKALTLGAALLGVGFRRRT